MWFGGVVDRDGQRMTFAEPWTKADLHFSLE